MRGTADSGWKRVSAVLSLLTWVGALFLCSSDCLVGQCHSNSEASHDHPHFDSHSAERHSPEHEHGHTPGKVPEGDGFCASLKSTALASYFTLVKPEFSLVQHLPSAFLAPGTFAASFDPAPLRQAKRASWVFMHEVCTSPANRSHAPPLLI